MATLLMTAETVIREKMLDSITIRFTVLEKLPNTEYKVTKAWTIPNASVADVKRMIKSGSGFVGNRQSQDMVAGNYTFSGESFIVISQCFHIPL